MKSFTLFLIASTAIISTTTTVAAINEPIASPTSIEAIQNELDQYERELGTGIPGNPTLNPGRPTATVRVDSCLIAFFVCVLLLWTTTDGCWDGDGRVGRLEFDKNGRHCFLHVMCAVRWCAYDGVSHVAEEERKLDDHPRATRVD
jgi:hypothetical protein